jgi:hypothetical protein
LFYFSGHGSRVPAPSTWPIAWKDVYDEQHEIEMILPYDSVRDTRELRRDREVTGIPDRTLGSLLRKIAAKHGPNLTVILDCCASGHGTRSLSQLPKGHRTRSVDAAYVGRLTEDTDQALWADDQPSGSASTRRPLYLRGAFVDRQDDTHVLLAACGRKEESNGSVEGGWFTTALIQALKDPAVYPRSYAEILKHVRSTFSDWYREFQSLPLDQRPEPQTPQCEGINRDRVIFQNTIVDRSSFPVQPIPHRAGHCQLDVGDVYGIERGTLFELRRMSSLGSTYTVVGTAVAVEVEPGSCIVQLPEGISAATHHLLASVTNVHQPLRYAVVNDRPESTSSVTLFGTLKQQLRTMSPETSALCVEVAHDDQPELVLRVRDDGVILDRKDLQMSYLTTPQPFVEAASVRQVFPEAMARFARFNSHLQRDNPEHPYAHEIDIRLHALTSPADPVGNNEQEYMIPGKEYVFRGQEAVLPVDDTAIYCIVLENYSQDALFPYIVYFDPATYSIKTFYSPISPHEPPLKAGGQLQLGRSSESMSAMSFYLDGGIPRDTGFLKAGLLLALSRPISSPSSVQVYLSSDLLDLSYLEQQGVLGPDAGVPSHQSRTGGAEELQPVKGVWDVVTRKVTVDKTVPRHVPGT